MNKQYAQMRRLYERGYMDERRYAQISMDSYYKDPRSFSEEQSEELYQFAKERNIDFEKDPSAQESALGGALNQLASGVVEGFTTFGWADDPDNQTEALLNKAGHLIGFAPDIIAGVFTFGSSLPGSVARKSAFRAARLKAGEKVKTGLGDFGKKYIPALTITDKAGGLQLRSVPMRAADWVMEQGKTRLGGAEFLRNNYIGKKLAANPDLLDIMEESAHLGIAMAVSARKEGPDGWAESAQHGALAGAFFGSVRNYVNIGTMLASRNPAVVKMANSKIKESMKDTFVGPSQPMIGTLQKSKGFTTVDYDKAQYIDFITRGTLGSAFTGGQSTMHNAPFEDQMYEYALGFFFGAAGRPKFESKATQKLVENMVGNKGEPDKIFTVVQEGQNMIINGADMNKMQWYKDLGPKEKRYIDAFQADIVLDQINRIGNNQSDVVLQAIKNKLEQIGPEGIETLSKREKVRILLQANKEAKAELIIKNETFLEAHQKDLSKRPDVDVAKLKEGETVDVYTALGKIEPVEVTSIKDGLILVKDSTGNVFELNKTQYFTKNVFNPDFAIPNVDIVPEKFRDKKLNELKNEEKTELQEALKLELKSSINKANQIPEFYDAAILTEKAVKVESIRSNKNKTDSEIAALEAELNPESLKSKEKRTETEPMDVIDTQRTSKAREILDDIAKDVPDLNAVETKKIMKLLSQRSSNKAEFMDGVAEFIKQKRNELPDAEFQKLRKYFIGKKGKENPLNALYFEYSGAKERQTLTIQKQKAGEGFEYIIIETPTQDGYNKSLLLSREDTYHNKSIEGSKPTDIKIQYIKTDGKFEKTGSKIGQSKPFVNKFEIKSDMHNMSQSLRTDLNPKFNDRYIHHINPSNNELVARRFAFSDKAGSKRYLPEHELAMKFIEKDFSQAAFEKFNKEMQPTHTYNEFKKEILSNMIYELQDAGMLPRNKDGSLTNISSLDIQRAWGQYKNNPLFKDIIKWTQYRKVVENGRSLSFDTAKYGPDGIKALIIKDSNGVFGISDGQKYYSKRLRKDVLEEAGRDLEEGYIKDVIVTDPVYNVSPSKSRGMLFNKSAEQATHEGIYKLMEMAGADIIIVESSSKSNSRHQVAEVVYDAKTDAYRFKKKGELFNVQSRDIKMIKSEAEVRNKKIQRLPFGSIMMRSIGMGLEYNNAMESLFSAQIPGLPGYTKKVMSMDPSKPSLIEKEGINIDNMDIFSVVEQFNRNIDTPLGSELIRSLFEKDLEVSERFGEEITSEDTSIKSVQDLLKQFDYDPIVLRIGNNHKYVEQALKKYINTRLSRPRVDYGSTYVRMKAADPMLLKKINLTDNNFYLHDGHRKDLIDLQKENGKDYTLEEAFTELKGYRAKKKLTKTDENRVKQLEDAITYVIVRSPVGNPSGVLSLEFGGFTDIVGKGIIMSKKNVERAGGADFDGDAVGLYQSLPQAIKKNFQNKKITELLNNTDLTKIGEAAKEAGFVREEGKYKGVNAMNIINPKNRAGQAAEVVAVSKMIGKTTNLMQFVREHLNYISQSPDGRVRLNKAGDSYLKLATNIDGVIKKNGVVLKNVEEVLDFFEAFDAPNFLNLVLDGAKNSKNPTPAQLESYIFDRYFQIEVPDFVSSIPRPSGGLRPSSPIKIEGVVYEGATKFNSLHNQKDQFFTQSTAEVLETIYSNTQSNFYKNKGNHIYQNKEIQIIRKGNEAVAYEKLLNKLLSLEEIPANERPANYYAEVLEIKSKMSELGVQDALKRKPVWKNHDKAELEFEYEPGGDRMGAAFKDIAYINTDLRIYDALGSRRKFLNALKRGVNEGGEKTDIGTITDIAENYLSEYTYSLRNGRRYTDSALNIAENFGRGEFFERLSFNVKPLNDASFADYTLNILRALDKVRSSETMMYLRKQGIIDPQLLAFTDGINSKVINGLKKSPTELREIFDIYSEILTDKNAESGMRYDQGYLTEQVMKLTGLLNFEVQASQAREALKSMGMKDNVRLDKISEVIDVAYKLKLADKVKELTYQDGITQEFDIDVAAREYRTGKMRKVLVGDKVKTLNKEVTDIFSEMFSNALLSNIFTTQKTVASYYNRIRNPKDSFLNDYGITLEGISASTKSTIDAMRASSGGSRKNVDKVTGETKYEFNASEGNYNKKIQQTLDSITKNGINNINTTELVKLFDHARRIEVQRPNLLKSDAIPLAHKRRFLLGMKDILTKGETVNRDIVLIKTDNIKSDISSIDTVPAKEKVSENTIVRDFVNKNVKKKLKDSGILKEEKVTIKPKIEVVKKLQDVKETIKDFVIAENSSQADLIENIFNMTEADIVGSAKRLAEVELNKMTDKEKFEYLENEVTPIEMRSLEAGKLVREKTLITESLEYEIKRLTDAIEKNPDIAVAIEGDFTYFSKMVGLTGLPEVGKPFEGMMLSDLRYFNNYVKDVYLSRDSMIGKMKKYANKVGKNVFGNEFWSNKENVPKSPIDKMWHYYLQQSDTAGAGKALRAKEMLQTYVENIPVLDKKDGEYVITKKSMTRPLSTLEIVRQQVDFGNTFASTFQDYFEDIISESFSVFNTGDKRLQSEKDILVEAAVNARIYDADAQGNGKYGGLKFEKHTRTDMRIAHERSQKEIERMTKEHKEFRILDETGKGSERKVTPKEMVDVLNNRITDFYQQFVENIYNVNTVRVKGKVDLKESAKKRVLTNGFLDTNKVQQLMKDMKMGNASRVELMDNLIGMNELQFYKYEYELIKSIQNIKNSKGEFMYPDFNPKDPSTITDKIKREANALRQFTRPQFVDVITDANGRPTNYWTFTNHHQFKKNKSNIDNHVIKLKAEAQKKIRDMSVNQLPPHIKAQHLAGYEGYKTLIEAKDRYFSEISDHIHISMQRMRSENAGMADDMTQMVSGNKNNVIGAFMAGHQKRKGTDTIPGFGKDLNVLSRYVKASSKSYIDTLVGLRSTMLIDKFQKTNALKDRDTTDAWSGYMRESLQNMMGLTSMRNIELAGITKGEKKLLQAYVDSGLDKSKIARKIGNNYRNKQFLRDIDTLIAPDSYWYHKAGTKLKGKELRDAIQNYRMNEVNKINNVKNINKINRFGTFYHVTSDAAVVNTIRSAEERIGRLFGYKEGEFSIFGDLRMVKNPETGKMEKVSEDARRIALARKAKKFSDFEGKWELLALLSHPKTAITNLLGGSQNIYADTGWQPFRQAMNEDYLINTVFKGAKFKTKNPRTGETVEKTFESFKDIETWLSQEGFLEGMYIEQAGINKTFRDADMAKAAKEVINRLFEPKTKELLDSNPTEFDKIRKATIMEIGNKYGIIDALVQFGGTFMSSTEIKLRRTAALAHYLNARDVMMPLTSELQYNSPMLMHIAKKGIESSQFIYHSAFRSNYSNTSLGRVMTRFHPYAWNSIKRRRQIFKGAKYTEWSNTTNSSKIAQRQLTADLMSMSLAAMFTSTIFEYSLSPPMSWMQDTAQWLFGDEKERERAFFSQWPTTSFAPLQIVTPPIMRYVLPPINAIASGDYDSFVKFQLATFAPFGRLVRDIHRSYESPQMTVDFMTGVPIHRMGQYVTNKRDEADKQQELEDSMSLED